jgi:hypothetical protein
MIYKAIVIATLLLAAAWLTRKWVSSHAGKNSSVNAAPTETWLLKQASRACGQHNHERALGYLYQWLDYYGKDTGSSIRSRINELNSNELALAFNQTMESIYAGKSSESNDTCGFIKRLIAAIKKRDRPKFAIQSAVKLKLN